MRNATTPAWRVSQLTDGELIGRRAEIERKLTALDADSPRVVLLRGELAEITEEEADRLRIRATAPEDRQG